MTDRPKTGLPEVLAHLMSSDHDDEAPDLSGGRRVGYVITGFFGDRVLAHAVGNPDDKVRHLRADVLALKFKVDIDELPGHRFAYRVVPSEHGGQFMVDFEVVREP